MGFLLFFIALFVLMCEWNRRYMNELKKADPISISTKEELLVWAAQNVKSLHRHHIIKAQGSEIYTYDPYGDDCSSCPILRMNVQLPPGDVHFEVNYDAWAKKKAVLDALSTASAV